MARGKGQPKKPVLTKPKLEEVLGGLEIGATFREVAEVLGVDHSAIFYHMNKHDSFKERVLRARALGLEFRKMVFEDSIFEALVKIKDDPRYTVLVIFAAKAQLKWSDLSVEETQNNQLREVLATIVEKKRQLNQGRKGEVIEYSPPAKKQVNV